MKRSPKTLLLKLARPKSNNGAGTDVTIISFSKPVGMALEAAEVMAQKGISCEVINLLSIRPLD
jgi:pyruvate/2-oxoglutarate/acetoin dehydrogenase E1 component